MTEWLVDSGLGLALLLLAAATLYAPRLYTSVVFFMGFGLLMAIVWARLGAADLALAEAAIGAGLTGVLLMGALREHPPRTERAPRPRSLLWAALLPLAVLPLLVEAILPLSGGAQPLPAQVDAQLAYSGVSHPVTAVLLNFRSWDTLLELLVVLFALLGTRQLALSSRHPHPPWPLLLAWCRWLAPLAFLLGAYLLWRGAKAPGGAFQAGALWASAIVMLRLNGLLPTVSWRDWRLRLPALLGVTVFVLLAVATWLWGAGWLVWPPGAAKALILLVELAASVGIAITLALLVMGEDRELRP
ncbi:hydrogenase subunit MbhD domain-containing protein [Gilvimarinus algae]|uniref:DUF4040 domain-containing protein n=1 Tax=Gilvimarinus algae TaxID=3058037 RepID=A0ABT8TJH9_9GAMM|nr:hydrogenase subunit MbhD domain-containing protein [Gilvimarinus sp. SDUM040014]MDO3383740.1 DUF4040 domain-containing protein [Gilvimarinus sp. SDUM040014]